MGQSPGKARELGAPVGLRAIVWHSGAGSLTHEACWAQCPGPTGVIVHPGVGLTERTGWKICIKTS